MHKLIMTCFKLLLKLKKPFVNKIVTTTKPLQQTPTRSTRLRAWMVSGSGYEPYCPKTRPSPNKPNATLMMPCNITLKCWKLADQLTLRLYAHNVTVVTSKSYKIVLVFNIFSYASCPRWLRLKTFENLCLRQKPRKAAGLDSIPPDLCRHGSVSIAPHLHSVVCKALVSGIEPFDYKGGRLCALYKGKGDPDAADGYRGILLSNTFAKVMHAWARSRLLPTLRSRKTIGQLGGLPSQQTATGVQAVRLHAQVAQQKHLTSATIFLDLKAAFYHMLRELIFSTSNQLLHDVLQTILDENEFDIHTLAANLDALCAREITDIPPGLRALLADIHQHTWFCFGDDLQHQSECTHTRRGTRPGSPLADIGFNLMMSSLLQDLHESLMQLDDFVEGARALGTFVPPIVWVDDVAISLTTTSAESMEALIQDTIKAVHTAFRSRGLTLNLDRGKSEIIVMFRGAGANRCRTALFDNEKALSITTATDAHIWQWGSLQSTSTLASGSPWALTMRGKSPPESVLPNRLLRKWKNHYFWIGQSLFKGDWFCFRAWCCQDCFTVAQCGPSFPRRPTDTLKQLLWTLTERFAMLDTGRRSTWMTRTSCSASSWCPSAFSGPNIDFAFFTTLLIKASPSTRRCFSVNLNNDEVGWVKLQKIFHGFHASVHCPFPSQQTEKTGLWFGKLCAIAADGHRAREDCLRSQTLPCMHSRRAGRSRYDSGGKRARWRPSFA